MVRRLDKALSFVEDLLIVVLTLAGLTMAFLQVILRYVFNTGIHWLEAGLVTALIWAMLIGASRAVREGLHPRVELLPHLASPKIRAVLNVVALLSATVLVLYFFWDAAIYAQFLDRMNALHPELGIKQLYPFLIVPIMTAMMTVRHALMAWALFKDPDALSPATHYRELVSLPSPEDEVVK